MQQGCFAETAPIFAMDRATTTAAPERCLGGGTTSVFHPLEAEIWQTARSTAAVCCTRQSKANTHLVKASASLWIMNENNSQQRTDAIEKDHRKRCVSFTWRCAAARRPEGLHIFHIVQMYFLKGLLSPWSFTHHEFFSFLLHPL